MKKPMFLLTRKLPLNIQRFSLPTFTKGKLDPSVSTSVTIQANVQPLTSGTGTQFLPEEAKVKRALMVWSADEIRQKIENSQTVQQQADRFVWENELYEVIRVRYFRMGVLDHYEALAVVVDPE